MLSFNISTLNILTVLVYSFFLSTFTAASGEDRNLEARKSVDHNLGCIGELPPAPYWPSTAPPWASFLSLTQLCGWVVNQPTAGCLCDKPYTHVECRAEIANPVLYQEYHLYCLTSCMCTIPADPDKTGGGGQRPNALVLGSNTQQPPSPFEAARNRAGVGTARRALEAECGGSCTTITQQCSLGFKGQCKCTAQPLGAPHDSISIFSGSCAAVHTRPKPGRKKRHDQNADGSSGDPSVMDDTKGFFDESGDRVTCPCNATYVSYSCCESATGLVWETPDKKLGKLQPRA